MHLGDEEEMVEERKRWTPIRGCRASMEENLGFWDWDRIGLGGDFVMPEQCRRSEVSGLFWGV